MEKLTLAQLQKLHDKLVGELGNISLRLDALKNAERKLKLAKK